MIAQDIVDRLSAYLPRHTDGFSESLAITAMGLVGSIATVTTASNHDLIENQNVAISGVDAPVEIDTATFLRTATFATFKTLQDHDFTLSERDKSGAGKTLAISGASETEFNGTFSIVRVVNRRELIISVDDSGPTTITGTPIVENANGGIFNGLYPAINVGSNTFDIDLGFTYSVDPVVGNAVVQTSIRILSVLDIEQYLSDIYTKKDLDDDVLVVQLGDVVASKSRNEETDASTSTIGEYSYTPVLIQSFAIYIIQNVTDELTGADARDKVEFEYVPAIFSSVLRSKFNTGFTNSGYRCTFTGHGVFAYSDAGAKNKAIYAHELTFECLAQLCRTDMVGPDSNVAMRDVSYALTTDLGVGELNADVDLDEEPIE